MAGTNAAQHAIDFSIDGSLFFRCEVVVARLNQPCVIGCGKVWIAIFVIENPAFAFGDAISSEFRCGELIAPVTKCTLGEFHDVALVHQGHMALFPLEAQRVLNCTPHMALRSFFAHRLDADA